MQKLFWGSTAWSQVMQTAELPYIYPCRDVAQWEQPSPNCLHWTVSPAFCEQMKSGFLRALIQNHAQVVLQPGMSQWSGTKNWKSCSLAAASLGSVHHWQKSWGSSAYYRISLSCLNQNYFSPTFPALCSSVGISYYLLIALIALLLLFFSKERKSIIQAVWKLPDKMFGENCHPHPVFLCKVWEHFQHLYKMREHVSLKMSILNLNVNILIQTGKLDMEVFICDFKQLSGVKWHVSHLTF